MCGTFIQILNHSLAIDDHLRQRQWLVRQDVGQRKMLPDKIRLIETVSRIDVLLHTGQYSELERLSGGECLTAEEMKIAIEDYPEELTQRPTYDLEAGSIIHVSGSSPTEWSVYLRLLA